MSEGANTFRSLFEQAEQTSEFWRQTTTLDFAEELSFLMAEAGVTRAELARRLGTSPAAITQMLRADRNLTLETMTKLAMVFGRRVCVHLAPQRNVTTWQDSPSAAEDSEPAREDELIRSATIAGRAV